MKLENSLILLLIITMIVLSLLCIYFYNVGSNHGFADGWELSFKHCQRFYNVSGGR